ncbi:MAG: hypothetical protein EXX96DRAFT_482828 [Benjaminiella poitrasii]|nr:MAG: hypothetical protein EXX96DRAFT_482828 [Benjaminiella poitrasii]
MNLPEAFKNYKVGTVKEGPLHFFSLFTAEHWDAENYLEQTHHGTNKSKKFSRIMLDYIDDLNWVRQLQETPYPIKEYITSLLNQKKPTKAKLLSNLANKKRKIHVEVHRGTIVNGDQIQYNNIVRTTSCLIDFYNSSRKRKVEKEEAEKEEDEKEEDEKEENGKKPSTWQDWLKFLKEHRAAFHPYSPEANGIIRAGNGVSSKPYLDRNMYRRHVDVHEVKLNEVPEQLRKIVSEVTETDGLDAFRRKIKQEEGNDDLGFLESIFLQCFDQRYEAYTSPFADHKYEDTFNQLYIWPFMSVVANYTTAKNGKVGFQTGQPRLESMSTQLKAAGIIVNDKSCYKTDGLLSLFATRNVELLLVETSDHLGSSDQVKIKFDHHKAMFGLLSMIKTVAGEYQYASLEQFSTCKFFYLHGAGKDLQLWSLIYQEGVFDFWLEATVHILPKFEDVDTFLPELVEFFWLVKGLLNEAVKNVESLREEHLCALRKNKFQLSKLTNLNSFVNPVIMKLTQQQDILGIGSLGPMYSPPHH